jgi:hypothetical protein
MSDGAAGRGDIKARLYERARDLGYDSITAFANDRPTASLVALAEELGREDIAGVQVLSVLLHEAEQRRQVTRFVRDVLARMLSQSLPEGWPAVLDDANRFKIAKALGRWSGYAPETYKERVDRVGDALLFNPPPAGWLPLGPDDGLLRMLLPDDAA